jgi:DNA-binding transcriptional LysR family regulator
MDAGDLKVFEAVARLGGMNRAAAELNTVQSNVTARIQALEADIGSVLLERHSRGVSLTQAGRRLLPYADKVARLLADARRAALDDGQPRGLLTIGSLETTAALRLTPLLTRYAADCPEVDLTLRTGTTCELVQDVLEQRVDGAFVCGPVTHADLAAQPMFHEELVVLTPPGVASLEAVFRTGEVRLVVLRLGCSYRQMLETMLARRGIVVQRQLEFGTLEAIFGCVSAGLGITLLPRALVGRVCEAGRVAMHRLPPEDAMVETIFIRRRDGFASSALRAFLACAGNATYTLDQQEAA